MKSLVIVLLCALTIAHPKVSQEERQIVVAILTQPKSSLNSNFSQDEYVLDINRQYIEASGAVAVPLYYDISDEDLF